MTGRGGSFRMLAFALLFVNTYLYGVTVREVQHCADHSSCPDFSICDNSTCSCMSGFSLNTITGDCYVTSPCTTNKSCGGQCSEVDGADTCFCPHGLFLASDGHFCQTISRYFFRFDLNVSFNSTLAASFYSAFQEFLIQSLTEGHVHHDDVTGEQHLALHNGVETTVIMKVDFVNFTSVQMQSVEAIFGGIIHGDQPTLTLDGTHTDIAFLKLNLYKSLQDAVNDDDPEDLSMCSYAHPCNQTKETCVDLRGTAFHCVYFFRGLLQTRYNESHFEDLLTAIVNLTENFLNDAQVHYTPVELLTFLPEDNKEHTSFIVYSDVGFIFSPFQLSFIEHFYVKAVQIPLHGALVDMERIEIYSSPHNAVAGIYHMPIAICGTKYSHCPRGINCVEHYDGTYNCQNLQPFHYHYVNYGYWRALVDVPFSPNMTVNASIAVAERIQTYLREDMYLGPIVVRAVDSGEDDDKTYVVVEIGFSIQSFHGQKYLIHEGFVVKEPTFTVTNENSSVSTHHFEYVKLYTTLGEAIEGGTGQIINEGCLQSLCPAKTDCIATDFRYRCEPYCHRGSYTDGDSCASCGPGKTTFYGGSHFESLCILQCPKDQEYNVFAMDCHSCPDGFFSVEDDPRCYFCNSGIENGTACEDDIVSESLNDVADIRMDLTLSYAMCPHLDVDEGLEINVTHFLLELITSHANDPVYNGVCFLDYGMRQAAHCENAAVELESETCVPDPSCVPDGPCHKYSTNLTLTIYNTLLKYAVPENPFNPDTKFKYMQSAESAIAESLFDHSALYRSFEGDQLQLHIILRGHPHITPISREDAMKRHIHVVVFHRDGLDIHQVQDMLHIELSLAMARRIPDFLYFQMESSWELGSHLDNLIHFALVFKEGADDWKVNQTADVLLSMHTSVGGTIRNVSVLTGPMSIHMSSDTAENTIEWCAARERLGKPLNCPQPTECHNYHNLEKTHDLVECSAPGISKVFVWVAIEKPFNQADDEAVGEHLVELFNQLLASHDLHADVTWLDIRYGTNGDTLTILEADYARTLSDADLVSLSVFAYEYFITTHHTVRLTNTSSFNVSFFELFLSKRDAWTGVNALVHPLCNATLVGFNVCPNDSICIDTTQGPDCIGLCEPGRYHDGSGCLECPENTTTLLWGAESVEECFEKCGASEGFDYTSRVCEICPGSLISSTDQQFCFHNSSSEVSTVNITVSVNVSMTDCNFLYEINPYDFNIGANVFIQGIFTNRKHGYILRGLCHPEDLCSNIKVHVKSENSRPTCHPSPLCTGTTDCHKYQMMFTIDFIGADNQVLVHDTDTLRRSTLEVVMENLAFLLQRTQNPVLAHHHGIEFEYQTADIQMSSANDG